MHLRSRPRPLRQPSVRQIAHDPTYAPHRPAADLVRLFRHVPGHVHGDPRHPDRDHVAAHHPQVARHRARCDELDPDRLSHRRDCRHPAYWLPDPPPRHAPALCRRGRPVHAGLGWLRGKPGFQQPDRLAYPAGLFRGDADPGGILGGVPAVSAALARAGDHDRRGGGGARAHCRADRGRLDHPDLVLALAVPDQRGAGDFGGGGGGPAPHARAAPTAKRRPNPRSMSSRSPRWQARWRRWKWG
jgi:hypothetical protein